MHVIKGQSFKDNKINNKLNILLSSFYLQKWMLNQQPNWLLEQRDTLKVKQNIDWLR